MDINDKIFFIDTHAHLDMIKGMSPEEAVSRSRKKGVKYIINIGSSISGSDKSVKYSTRLKEVYASVGVHPHDAKDFGYSELSHLKGLIKRDDKKKIVAIGETGFDLYRNLSSIEKQEKAFVQQIELALDNDLPLIIHNRDADDYTISVLKRYIDDGLRGVVHCFSGDLEFAQRCLDLGLYISFTGVITYPKTTELEKVVRYISLDKVFLETDAPFLSPQVLRGKENYPGNVYYIALRIADIKDISLDKVAETTSRNALAFFGIG